jgi:acetyl-CoA acetyltransferase
MRIAGMDKPGNETKSAWSSAPTFRSRRRKPRCIVTTKPHDSTAIVGIGATPFTPRGGSVPATRIELAGNAILVALRDAGLTVRDVDGFALYHKALDTALLAQVLGVPEVRFTASITGGGGGSAGSIGLAAAAITSGNAEVVVCCTALQQASFGRTFATREGQRGRGGPAELDFIKPSGLVGPGQMIAMLAQRHMHLFGTRREHFAEVAIATRANATRRATARFRDPLTLDDYFNAPMLSDPLCLYDYCMDSDGAVACIVTSLDRARDLARPLVRVVASAHGGHGRWGQAITWLNMPDDYFCSSGHRPVADRLFASSGLTPADIDVALLYDHFTPAVLMQLEDYGFCPIGEGGSFVEDGNIRWPGGNLPINTHGGHLSEAYMMGMTHVVEAVEQLRGTAVNQVDNAEVALVTGGPGGLPTSSVILGRG